MTETTTISSETAVTPQRAKGATKAAKPSKKASAKKNAPKATKAAKKAKKPEAAAGRDGSKKAIVLQLLRRPKGATLQELMAATEWQPHSIRGFISGALGKKMGLQVESERRDDGQRNYRIA